MILTPLLRAGRMTATGRPYTGSFYYPTALSRSMNRYTHIHTYTHTDTHKKKAKAKLLITRYPEHQSKIPFPNLSKGSTLPIVHDGEGSCACIALVLWSFCFSSFTFSFFQLLRKARYSTQSNGVKVKVQWCIYLIMYNEGAQLYSGLLSWFGYRPFCAMNALAQVVYCRVVSPIA